MDFQGYPAFHPDHRSFGRVMVFCETRELQLLAQDDYLPAVEEALDDIVLSSYSSGLAFNYSKVTSRGFLLSISL